MLRTRALATVALRQRFAVPVCQRMLHTSVRLNTAEGNNLGEALANKFTGQVKKTRNSVVEPTRFVKIDTLPITATTEDIRKLAREAFSDGDKSIIESEFLLF
jgi:hypothetical protein